MKIVQQFVLLSKFRTFVEPEFRFLYSPLKMDKKHSFTNDYLFDLKNYFFVC